ncbi:MAG TPA: extracellular matrix/biofilm biosynthesis regulator RemA family protein [Oscillospiraceae bacterium]|nr:extracellular matrix/biofilm biosynthesis regulator RemA family protein [Oscillospiraceae bacterium]
MFLHIGGSRIVRAKDIIGIFDIRLKDKQCNKEFLQSAKQITKQDSEETKTFIVTESSVLFSPIAPTTLRKRFQAKIFETIEK